MKRFAAVAVFVMFAGVGAFAQGKVDDGKAAYAANKCATCHAIGGAGGKFASALDGVGAKMKAEEIKKWLNDPAAMEAKLEKKPKMLMSASPTFKTKKLTPADVDNLTAYMLSLTAK